MYGIVEYLMIRQHQQRVREGEQRARYEWNEASVVACEVKPHGSARRPFYRRIRLGWRQRRVKVPVLRVLNSSSRSLLNDQD